MWWYLLKMKLEMVYVYLLNINKSSKIQCVLGKEEDSLIWEPNLDFRYQWSTKFNKLEVFNSRFLDLSGFSKINYEWRQ